MQQLLKFWTGLDFRRQIVVLVSTIAIFLAVLGLSRLANAPSYALLYSGLEADSAGEVVKALEQRGVTYDVRGGSIYVDASERDQLRLTLASEGLPMASGQGYELLDSISGFGTTAQMFDAAYWRAKEGELARTIQSASQIRSARVHIANTSDRPFQSGGEASASVTAIATSGAISATNARAIRHLVASAVSGLSPANVSVIDGRSGTVVAADDAEFGNHGADDRAAALKRNVERLLIARVGTGNAVVEISVETVREREAITQRTIDPEGRVAISSETEESTSSASDSGSGSVTVASNLPDGDAGGAGQNSSSQDSRTRELVNYEVSETMREVLRSPGAIRRISTAVLVNGLPSIDPATGESTWQPRSDQEMAALRELVASTVGFDEARGDVLTIKSMELAAQAVEGTETGTSLTDMLALDVMRLIQVGVLAVVAMVLGLFVVRPILTRPEPPAVQAFAGPVDDGLAALGGTGGPAAAAIPTDFQMQQAPLAALDGEIEPDNGLLPGEMPGADGTVTRLKQVIDERGDETVDILRNWIEGERVS